MRNFTSKIIGYKKDDEFIAVALDFDLITEGATLLGALNSLNEAIRGYLIMCLQDNESDKQIYRKAPKKYFDLYDLFLELAEKKKENKKYQNRFLASLNFDNRNLCV